MIITKVRDLNKFIQKSSILFIYFYEDFCKDITLKIDNFFKEKYDLNKNYLKVKVSNSENIINKLDVTIYPIIKIYKSKINVGEIYCNNNNLLYNLEKTYNNIL